MIWTDKTKKALKFMFKAHRKQTDKSGIPYVFHPYHLAEQMKTEETTIVALLHDVVEDTRFSFKDIKKQGFSEEVITALKLLTHDKKVDYFDYVRSIKENEIASAVKLADLKHNSDITRLDDVSEKALERREKYLKAIKILEE